MMADRMLNVVDDNDQIITTAMPTDIHSKGLRHREVHVWFVTPDKEIIFQERLPKPPLYPLPILDATVGGHVELGQSYIEAALMEVREETGLDLQESDLLFYTKSKIDEEFPQIKKLNNVYRSVYVYQFHQDLNALQIEEGWGQGFAKILVHDLLHHADKLHEKYFVIPYMLSAGMMKFYKEVADGRYVA